MAPARPPTRPTSRPRFPRGLLLNALTIVACAVILGLGLAQLPGQARRIALPGVGEQSVARIDSSGRLLVPYDEGLAVVTLPERTTRLVMGSEQAGVVQSARWTPDGQAVTYAAAHPRPGDMTSLASSEILMTDFVGSPRLLVQRDRPGGLVEAPSWTSDGRTLYFGSATLEGGRLLRRIERLDVARDVRSTVAEGELPEISPDGGLLVFVRVDRAGYSLVGMRPDERDARLLIPPGRFSQIGSSRFSPDGRTLAIPIGVPPGQATAPRLTRPWGLLDSGVAFAHGDPWDVFLLDLASGQLRRLSQLLEDELSVAWSPDGVQLAAFAARGLHLLSLTGRTALAMDRGGSGGIDWVR